MRKEGLRFIVEKKTAKNNKEENQNSDFKSNMNDSSPEEIR